MGLGSKLDRKKMKCSFSCHYFLMCQTGLHRCTVVPNKGYRECTSFLMINLEKTQMGYMFLE